MTLEPEQKKLESQVGSQIKWLCQYSEKLNALVDRLPGLLESVFLPKKEEKEVNQVSPPIEPTVPLAHELYNINSNLRATIEKFETILERIDL